MGAHGEVEFYVEADPDGGEKEIENKTEGDGAADDAAEYDEDEATTTGARPRSPEGPRGPGEPPDSGETRVTSALWAELKALEEKKKDLVCTIMRQGGAAPTPSARATRAITDDERSDVTGERMT